MVKCAETQQQKYPHEIFRAFFPCLFKILFCLGHRFGSLCCTKHKTSQANLARSSTDLKQKTKINKYLFLQELTAPRLYCINALFSLPGLPTPAGIHRQPTSKHLVICSSRVCAAMSSKHTENNVLMTLCLLSQSVSVKELA